MTTSLGGITIDIDARMVKLEQNLQKANAKLDRFSRDTKRQGQSIQSTLGGMDKSFQGLTRSVVAFASGIGVHAMLNFGKSVLDFADDLVTAADQAGISVERFQTLREALRALEIAPDAADKALKRLNGTLGDVQNGVEDEATKALDQMGVSARILSGEIRTTDGLLDALAEASTHAGSKAQFASQLVDILGRRVGVDMAAALADGGVALRQLEEEFRRSGHVIDQEQIDKLAEANEAIDKFTAQTKQDMAIWAADNIDLFKAVGDGLGSLAGDFGRSMSDIIAEVRGARAIWEKEGFWSAFWADGATLRAAGRPQAPSSLTSLFGVDQMMDVYKKANRLAVEPPPVIRPRGGGGGSARKGGSRSGGLSEAQRLTQEYEKHSAELDRQLLVDRLRHEGMDYSADLLEMQARIMERFGKLDEKRLNALLAQEKAIIDQKAELLDMREIEARFAAEKEALEKAVTDSVTEDMDRMAKRVEASNVRIAKSFKDTADETLSSLSRMSDAVRGGDFLSILEAVIGLGLQLGSVGAFGKEVADNINRIDGARAAGGPVRAGGTYLVGENGPELFTPGRSGQIVANDRLASAGAQVAARVQPISMSIVPSPLFEVVMDDRAGGVVQRAAPAIAAAGAGGAQVASARRQARRIR